VFDLHRHLCYHFEAKKSVRVLPRGEAISKPEYRVNEQIRAREVRLIAEDGEQIGVVPLREALNAARGQRLDLVEVAPNARPPVCRIMDHGKFLYERAKREREARKSQKQVEVKEIRFRPKTDEYHRGFKVKRARDWLKDGAKVKVRILFRGREITHPEIGQGILREVADELSDVGQVEQDARLEGRTMLMLLSPRS
jgi:translation initiation factor IF-3